MRSAGDRRLESGAVLCDLPPWAITTAARGAPRGPSVRRDGVWAPCTVRAMLLAGRAARVVGDISRHSPSASSRFAALPR